MSKVKNQLFDWLIWVTWPLINIILDLWTDKNEDAWSFVLLSKENVTFSLSGSSKFIHYILNCVIFMLSKIAKLVPCYKSMSGIGHNHLIQQRSGSIKTLPEFAQRKLYLVELALHTVPGGCFLWRHNVFSHISHKFHKDSYKLSFLRGCKRSVQKRIAWLQCRHFCYWCLCRNPLRSHLKWNCFETQIYYILFTSNTLETYLQVCKVWWL